MTNLTHNSFLYMFISTLYMFRAFKCSSFWDSIASIRYLAYATLCRWPSGMQVWTERDFPHLSRPALRSTPSPIRVQWVPGLYRG